MKEVILPDYLLECISQIQSYEKEINWYKNETIEDVIAFALIDYKNNLKEQLDRKQRLLTIDKY